VKDTAYCNVTLIFQYKNVVLVLYHLSVILLKW